MFLKTVFFFREHLRLCPWPWPRALCPRLHLCKLESVLVQRGLNYATARQDIPGEVGSSALL